MTHEEDRYIASELKRIGRSMEVLGLVGGAIGLGIAVAAGPITVGAVLAEVSLDIALGASGAFIDRFKSRIAPRLSESRLASRLKMLHDHDADKQMGSGKTIGLLALATIPFELITGFAIAGISNPVSVAAVLVTSLPCAAIAVGGLIHDRISKRRTTEREETIQERKRANETAMRQVAEPVVETKESALKALRRNAARRLKNII